MLVSSSTFVETPSQRFLLDISIISVLLNPTITTYLPITDSLPFTTINPHFCNPYYYPCQGDDEVRF